MRWNPFRRAVIADASDSSFESTVVDDAAAARIGAQADRHAALRAVAGAPAGLVESESIGHVGRYALKSVLGKGGLGTVYAAWDPLLSRAIALKTLHIDADPAARESLDALFLNEARAAAGLSHPHIVTVFDAGPSETGVYIAMERLQGQDLRHLLQQGVRPGPIESAQVVRRVADALAYAHRKGVVHCDVKPANIFMTGRMHPKVLDFGIARVAHRDVPALEGITAGSPYYLAPEQIDGRSVDRRSDVYSLGVVLYELLTGKKPFEGKSLDEIMRAVKTDEVVPAHRVSAKVPLGLSVIADRAMARDPDQRFPSARHLAMELRHWEDSAEARALRSDTPGGARNASRTMRVARVVVPLAALGVIGGLWWARSAPSDITSPNAASVPAPPNLRALTPLPPASAAVAAMSPGSAVATVPAAADAGIAAALGTASGAVPGRPASGNAVAVAVAVAGTSIDPVAAASAARAADKAASKAEATRKRRAQPLASANASAAMPSEGVVQLAVTPWGQVEVDGRPLGISPPLTRLTLAAGSHTVTVRNADFPAYTATLTVSGQNPVTLRHRFGP